MKMKYEIYFISPWLYSISNVSILSFKIVIYFRRAISCELYLWFTSHRDLAWGRKIGITDVSRKFDCIIGSQITMVIVEDLDPALFQNKDCLYGHRYSHHNNKTVMSSSYLNNANSYIGKTALLSQWAETQYIFGYNLLDAKVLDINLNLCSFQ